MEQQEFKITVEMDAIFVSDEIEGYTAWTKARPDIIAEGRSLSETIKNLENAIYDVFIYESELDKNKKFNIINKDENII